MEKPKAVKLVVELDKLNYLLKKSSIISDSKTCYLYLDTTIFIINDKSINEVEDFLKKIGPKLIIVGKSLAIPIPPPKVIVYRLLKYTKDIEDKLDIIINYCNHPDCPIKLREKILEEPENIERWKQLILQEENYL